MNQSQKQKGKKTKNEKPQMTKEWNGMERRDRSFFGGLFYGLV